MIARHSSIGVWALVIRDHRFLTPWPGLERGSRDWRFTAGLFFITVLLETAAFGQLTAFTPLYLRQVIQLPEEEIPFWTGMLVATSLAVAVPLAPWWGGWQIASVEEASQTRIGSFFITHLRSSIESVVRRRGACDDSVTCFYVAPRSTLVEHVFLERVFWRVRCGSMRRGMYGSLTPASWPA